eukprot:CAMPEP_0178966204 /NCGR_PEP_ID=MMETSP0789-20121207/16782_1 /TAXON_ID=3005 /ORGANISM="Rhizosolenia setigera, Strain CCMP 1694" /LENGTH=91 /DNA_ID=CAMNT_0020651423 /DNA_START=37 /DNA_END=312 /DNA_ORIENTATION=-
MTNMSYNTNNNRKQYNDDNTWDEDVDGYLDEYDEYDDFISYGGGGGGGLKKKKTNTKNSSKNGIYSSRHIRINESVRISSSRTAKKSGRGK